MHFITKRKIVTLIVLVSILGVQYFFPYTNIVYGNEAIEMNTAPQSEVSEPVDSPQETVEVVEPSVETVPTPQDGATNETGETIPTNVEFATHDSQTETASSSEDSPTLPEDSQITEATHETNEMTRSSTAPGDSPEASTTETIPDVPLEIASSTTVDAPESSSTSTDEGDQSFTTTTPSIETETTTTTNIPETSPPVSDGSTSSPETVTVTTGDSIALANVLNVVNTSVVNSNGTMIFSNILEDQMGPVDFREKSTSTSWCALSTCEHTEGIELHLSNDAYVKNAILIDASSGENVIESNTTQAALIETGNSFTGLNLTNVVNTTIINSNYLLVSLHAFRDILGDIIFPNWSYGAHELPSTSFDTVHITNVSDAENIITADASAGMNTATGVHTSMQTGDAETATNIFNLLNASLIGGDSISILLNVRGTWVGEVFGLPSGMHVTQYPSGQYYITNTEATEHMQTLYTVFATNTARIRNDVSLNARTGNNEIYNANTAHITTGDAFTGANIVNIANTTVIGRNWTLAVLNIFGDFHGNLAFGRPDLWVGERITVPHDLENGKEVHYTFTVVNNGDAEATRITVSDTYDTEHLEIIDSTVAFTTDEHGKMLWKIENLAPGQSTEISYRARVQNAPPGTSITNVVAVNSRETDNDLSDNSDGGTVRTISSSHSSHGRHVRVVKISTTTSSTISPPRTENTLNQISVTRTTFSTIVENDSVPIFQKIIIQNPTDTVVESVILHDILSDSENRLVHDEVWDLGDLLAHEEITLEYEMVMASDTLGFYTFSTRVQSDDTSEILFPKNGTLLFLIQEPLPLLTTQSLHKPRAYPLSAVAVSETAQMRTFGIPFAYAQEETQTAATIQSNLPVLNSLYTAVVSLILLLSLYCYFRFNSPNRLNVHGEDIS